MKREVVIRDMRPEDMVGKSRVHYQSWQESYRGIVADSYLDAMSEEKCASIARRWPENTAVALVDGQVVGFVCWCPCRDQNVEENTGELAALYVLEEYKGQGIGWALSDYCMKKLAGYQQAVLWVLAENQCAIRFYQRYGFAFDGCEQYLNLDAPTRCVRMTKKI